MAVGRLQLDGKLVVIALYLAPFLRGKFSSRSFETQPACILKSNHEGCSVKNGELWVDAFKIGVDELPGDRQGRERSR